MFQLAHRFTIGRLAPCLLAAMALVATVVACRGAWAQEGFEGWHLEPGVGQAHLVMVARVASISRVTVVEGAKTDVTLREFRFQPVQRLKGIFQRDQLSMTAADLGIPAEDAVLAPPLKEGEFRLLILVQQAGLSMGCVSAAPGATTFNERVPLLSGPDDPLVAVVETLIRVADARSRRERATLLVDRLADMDGLAAVPLLSSLRLRADWAATDRRAYAAVARLVHDQRAAVSSGALEVLRDILASAIVPDDPRQFDGVADALRKVLESDEAVTRTRLTALESLGYLLALQADLAWPRELLIAQLTAAATHAERASARFLRGDPPAQYETAAATHAERAAAVTALAQISHPQAITAVLDALAGLPLDEPAAGEVVYARAAVRLDAAGAERVLLSRLKQSIAARQSLEVEIELLGRMRSKQCVLLLLAAAAQPKLPPADRYHIAWALGRLGDDRAVPVLVGWLRGDDRQLKERALAALESLDSPLAAREARPLLKTEPSLAFKLRLARLLARHEVADGYPLATEHLADVAHTADASLVLAALNDPRTAHDLSAILAARPDRRWHAAALSGLAAIGDAAARKQLLDILADERHPLAADAAEAAGLTADGELLLPLANLIRSRNRQIAMASLTALRRFLSGVRSSPLGLAAVHADAADAVDGELLRPAADIAAPARAAISEAVASIAVDTYVDADMRREALAVARLLGGQPYARLLSELADQSELEGAPLLAEVQQQRRRSQVLGKQPQ